MKIRKYAGTIVGVVIVTLCLWILYGKIQKVNGILILKRLQDIPVSNWLYATGASILAYIALSTYDALALKHLGKKISWVFITLSSFTTYALSHNIGASVFSGAAIRYRAYKTKKLSGPEITFIVAFCSLTFTLGVIFLSGIISILRPDIFQEFYSALPRNVIIVLGFFFLFLIFLYILGSWLQFPPLKIGKKFTLVYPNLSIVFKQIVLSSFEIICSALIIYFVLPEAVRPEFIVILGVFLASFSATLILNAPAGGLGVLEVVFIEGVPNLPAEDLLSSLLAFRILYLIIPLLISLLIVIVFEFQQWNKQQAR